MKPSSPILKACKNVDESHTAVFKFFGGGANLGGRGPYFCVLTFVSKSFMGGFLRCPRHLKS